MPLAEIEFYAPALNCVHPERITAAVWDIQGVDCLIGNALLGEKSNLKDVVENNKNWKSAGVRELKKRGGAEVKHSPGTGKSRAQQSAVTCADKNKQTDNSVNEPCNAETDICRADSCLLYTSPSPRDGLLSRMPSSA